MWVGIEPSPTWKQFMKVGTHIKMMSWRKETLPSTTFLSVLLPAWRRVHFHMLNSQIVNILSEQGNTYNWGKQWHVATGCAKRVCSSRKPAFILKCFMCMSSVGVSSRDFDPGNGVGNDLTNHAKEEPFQSSHKWWCLGTCHDLSQLTD